MATTKPLSLVHRVGTLRTVNRFLAVAVLSLAGLSAAPSMHADAGTIVYDFLTSDHGWTVVNDGTANWSYLAGTGWSTTGINVPATNYLVSPPLTVAATGTFSGSFAHYFNFEAGFDGGTISYRVVGAPTWTLVPLGLTGLNNTQPYNGFWDVEGIPRSAFSGALGSAASPVVTDFTLGAASAATFTAGDSLEIAFTGNWDTTRAEPNPNWVITSASFSNAVPEPSTFALAAAGLCLSAIAYRRHQSGRRSGRARRTV